MELFYRKLTVIRVYTNNFYTNNFHGKKKTFHEQETGKRGVKNKKKTTHTPLTKPIHS